MYSILIVDDDKSERDVIAYLLNSYGLQLSIIQAENGQKALDILRETSVDILITDVQMPFLNGIELTKKARALFPNIEVLFFSGHDDFAYIKSAMFLKAVNYLLKPVNPEEFLTSIMDILGSIKEKRKKTTLESPPFYDHNDIHSTSLSESSEQQDSALMAAIEHAVRLKDIQELENSIYSLLDKYSNQKKVSHLYIRYLCTTLMNHIIKLLPNLNSSDFQSITDRIYQFNRFSDLRALVEDYLEQAIDVIRAEAESPNHTVQLVEQYIHTHYREDISLNILADYVFLTPKYLSALFAQNKGISIKKYIKKIRMEKAKELLMNTNMKVIDIGEHVGYTNLSYFCKIFQEETSMTPNNYRSNKGEHDA